MNKQDIFKSYSLNQGTVEVENWGGSVQIQELSAAAIDEMRKLGEGKELKAAATIIIHGVINEDGKRMFAKNDESNLLNMSVTDLNTISEAILGLSGLNQDKEAAEA